MNSVRFSIAFEVWFAVQTLGFSQKTLHEQRQCFIDSKRRSSLRFWMEVNGAISSVKLNKICSTEGLTFNLCISLNHFIVLENSEIETSHSTHVCITESVLEQRLQWSSLAILNFLSSFLVMIILCNILNKNCLSLLSVVI